MVVEGHFYRLPVSDFIDKALKKLMSDRELNSHSITKDQFTGICGEYCFSRWCDENWVSYDWVAALEATPYDFLLGEVEKRYKIDVKTKKRSAPANLTWVETHIEERQEDFDCNLYVFASYCPQKDLVELMGWMAKKDYWANCRRVKKGDVDAGGHTEDADAGKLWCRELRPMHDLSNGLMEELMQKKTKYHEQSIWLEGVARPRAPRL
jgi:hypothetical protein